MLKSIYDRMLNRIAYSVPGGYSMRPMIHKKRGVTLGKNVWISRFVYIDELHPDKISIGDNCTIGLRTSIFTHFYWGPRRNDYNEGNVVIENDVFIGPHCVILPNVRIGAGSVIKAGTVVSRDVPAQTFWGLPSAGPLAHVGVPLTHEHGYDEFLKGMKPYRRNRA